MKTSGIHITFLLVGALLVGATSCVKDELYNTSHPNTGKIIITADWSDRGATVNIPSDWTVAVGDYAAIEPGETHVVDSLFNPGNYQLATYTTPAGIMVNGSIATAISSGGNGKDTFIANTPGWFFASVQQVPIEADTELSLTAAMHQQVRQLTFVIESIGESVGRVEAVEGRLGGVAGTLDFATGVHGTASDVELHFTKITEGVDAGKWVVTTRLLGIVVGERQNLSVTLSYVGANPQDTRIESDLTEALKNFNADKTVPMTLGGMLVETPGEMGMSSVILSEWERVNGESGNAEPK